MRFVADLISNCFFEVNNVNILFFPRFSVLHYVGAISNGVHSLYSRCRGNSNVLFDDCEIHFSW